MHNSIYDPEVRQVTSCKQDPLKRLGHFILITIFHQCHKAQRLNGSTAQQGWSNLYGIEINRMKIILIDTLKSFLAVHIHEFATLGGLYGMLSLILLSALLSAVG